jgi:nucleoid DNA-binding protein
MTRAEIVEALTNHLGLPLKSANEAVNVVLEAMVQALRRGEEIELRGFGCSVSGSGNPAPGVTPAPEKRWPWRQKRSFTSSPERS